MFQTQLVDASRDFSTIAATQALPAFGVLLIVAAVASWFLARRDEPDWSAVEWFVALATLAVIIAVTTLRGEIRFGFAPSNLISWGGGVDALSRDPLGSSQFMLNVALFIPAGIVWAWLTRRPLKTLGALAAFSFAMEIVQALTGVGVNDLVDLISNTAGAAIGTGIAAIALQLLSRRTATPLSTRMRTITMAAIAVVVTLVAVGWFGGASARQQRVEEAVREAFAGTNLQEIEQRVEDDAFAVFSAGGDYSDGSIYLPDSISYRYPATFFSLHRCVYVTWTADAVEFRKAAGSECSDFIDG